MNKSVTGTAVPSPPKTFSLQLIGRVGEQVGKELAAAKRARQLENERKRRETRAQAKHEVEMLALEYARIMQERHIIEALDPATEPRLRRDLRNDVINRGVGKPRDEDAEEAAARRKGGGADAMIDFLRAVTVASNLRTGISHQSDTPVPDERDVTPIEHDPDAQWFEQYPTSTEDDDHE